MTLFGRGGNDVQPEKPAVAIGHRFDGLGADFRIGIAEERGERLVLCRLAAEELSYPPDRMEPGERRGLDLRRGGGELGESLALHEFELRLHPHPLVGVSEEGDERGDLFASEIGTDPFPSLGAQGICLCLGHINAPDRAVFVHRVTAAPVDPVKAAVGSEVQPDERNAVTDFVIVHHRETVAPRFDLKSPLLAVWCACQEKVTVVFRSQSGPWIGLESGGAVLVEPERGGVPAGLSFVKRHVHLLVLPRVVAAAAVLPVRAPAEVGVLLDIDEALFFSREIGVVVDPEEIAVMVEGDLLNVALTMGEDFEV